MSGPADVWGISDVIADRLADIEDRRTLDYEGPCRLTVDAVLTITFPVTITVDKQAGEDEWDLRDRYDAELRGDVMSRLVAHVNRMWPDVELCDARIELP